ncbi:histidine biosynthesis bifunctional protein [Helicobacter mustelae]|uniref:bifunctional phosphoribosyl-AMP cyclohydrolase/phosphoribosyl-ATP diphosphatase HisIE n=1 Tax=Helicobacter mustelae TaxID=217 RepID=UPI000DFB7083|nr:bifunctional phosphoribosyl-AMP cyclohydrolase/phosphoribosyl-ATP diphosphatase HisIE [Helicobacter mustelae]STP13200.1 histidine biosynthesis bifunctional protein [Helicobacter mustelae]
MQKFITQLDWRKSPLIPAIIQDDESLEVLMLGFVNQEALSLSLETGFMHYFSRSKNRIWKKGESSGCFQKIKNIKLDCDRDSLLVCVEQVGSACHTGERSCFFRELKNDADNTISLDCAYKKETPLKDCDTQKNSHTNQENAILDTLYHILLERKFSSSSTSYTASLYQKGINTICKKITEEVGELVCEIKDEEKEKMIYETADVFYHIFVALAYYNIHPENILQELKRRFAFSGIEEKNGRKS